MTFYDGCNTCGCQDGQLTHCTEMFCEDDELGEAKCTTWTFTSAKDCSTCIDKGGLWNDQDGKCLKECPASAECVSDISDCAEGPPSGGRPSLDDCPRACPTVWKPVCGSDGKTYSNKCALTTARQCDKTGKLKTLAIIDPTGPCEDYSVSSVRDGESAEEGNGSDAVTLGPQEVHIATEGEPEEPGVHSPVVEEGEGEGRGEGEGHAEQPPEAITDGDPTDTPSGSSRGAITSNFGYALLLAPLFVYLCM
ncbi:unnamed protein product [Vitrella brassicaformis CCMP3155]|uniref:Kazal-like domain-containing protein n=1 Tax=Vitrella brassicaformis (strain CCMP3155) TaxID=1169540 RepID=A0A0G4EI52_VITBC|nr:unnamed protein product [Vitrella brassicaformis CCMP3155]|eukprot:CEL95656.1 unnamed protein product [Vitrella brassicaformis CCMP3155]